MKSGFRQSMAWVHTWGGLVVGWILFFVFLTGTLGYFDTEIDRWMKPELPRDTASVSQSLNLAQAHLEEQAPGAKRWFINPATNRDAPNLRIFWELPGEEGKRGVTGNQLLDSSTGEELQTRSTGGGQTLYRMHYALHYLPTGVAYWIVGICSMFMLVAIVTGVIIHKKIFKDFFTFRPQKGPRSWLDMHNLLSVVALPFHLMITYSGLVFFVVTYMPLIIASSYGTDNNARNTFFSEAFPNRALVAEPASQAAPLKPLTDMLAIAAERWGGEQEVRYIDIRNPGDANARVIIARQNTSISRSGEDLVFSGVTGELLSSDASDPASAPLVVRDALLGLHEGLFASIGLRWLYFFSGLLGTAMIATGLVLWTSKRRPQQLRLATPELGHRLVECLNPGMIVGLPLAIAAYFWANRLLPVEMATRSTWEVHTMFITLGCALLYPLVRGKLQRSDFFVRIKRCWRELLWFTAAAWALLPLVNALTTDKHLAYSLAQGDWLFAAFDGAFLLTALAFAAAALRFKEKTPQPLPAAPSIKANITEAAH
ncbi:PepSY-associated TM helix domain-containing protein [Cellvibrio japonicus]|uniref:Uncharacterized iron-regulated membrane protein DUF337 n=1 Tax=Cellvibrio japonicus (strain Ueda107) TaxID=498211 RepID=B3PCH9_CELJU|nr:PepSY-associated TM helix domain-containing protein [Cellvibrio japonicus]ACE86017.1 Uncharacterized iron-regulated membrane protein DUF337 [Cellvibrio japonicus Ueda107]QEI11882.1 PepSY domain-containing protein [Cellvibrio japonicus]QEI15456.1 PepSY domain-containing protein [Cellvibrio japonicus]QEI19035.1 PepSY domain-containing protein [Cellvibrio japonicus]